MQNNRLVRIRHSLPIGIQKRGRQWRVSLFFRTIQGGGVMSPIKLPITAAECVQAIRSPVMPDPETEAECVAFIREAFASSDRRTAIDIQNVLADVCQCGYADRAAIWNEHHLNKPPTARGRPQNPQTHSQKFEEIKNPAMILTTFCYIRLT